MIKKKSTETNKKEIWKAYHPYTYLFQVAREGR
jgi:hypothetical protein